MRVQHEPSSRSIRLFDLPEEVDGYPNDIREIEVHLTYGGATNAHKGVIFDKVVVPAIVDGLKLVSNRPDSDSFFKGWELTPSPAKAIEEATKRSPAKVRTRDLPSRKQG